MRRPRPHRVEPRNIEDEMIYHIANNNLVIPQEGCEVNCHGLVSEPHLNGGIGRSERYMKYDSTGTIRFVVHFEKKGVKSALVMPDNLNASHLNYRTKGVRWRDETSSSLITR